MNKYIVLIVSVLLQNSIYAQFDSLVSGGYRNLVELHKQSPSFKDDFICIANGNVIIPELFKVSSKSKNINSNMIKKALWCVYSNNQFYVNANRFGMGNGFIRMDTIGQYMYFKGKPVKSIAQQEHIKKSYINFGILGLATSNAIEMSKISNQIHYVFNIKTGKASLLSYKYVYMIVQPYPDLLTLLESETEKKSVETLKEYLHLVNNKVAFEN